ncbi:MAG TPA: hypothetical protein PK662_01855 [Bacteroidales bacterium]|nr:hypothetical protein [Bacteroidales bacterium]
MKKNIKKLSQVTNNCFFKVIFILFLTSCNESINYSKNNHIGTKEVAERLYMETYRIYSGGVYGGDVYTVYLTDSAIFRIYLGKEFDHEQIRVAMSDDETVMVYKVNIKGTIIDTIKKEFYNISLLKQEGKFE